MFFRSEVRQILAFGEAVDMRRSFDGLVAVVESALEEDPLAGTVYVFFNRRGTILKSVYWDRTGYCLWCKRLERGRFRLPGHDDDAAGLEIESSELTLLLEGIELAGARRHKRYRRE